MKVPVLLSLIFLLAITGCEKKYDLDDISSFDLYYNTGSGWSGYFYDLQIKETGVLDIHSRTPLSDSTRHSVYIVDKNDLEELKPFLVGLINTDVRRVYGNIVSQASDYPVTGVILKSNKKNIETTIYEVSESELPESLKNILEVVSDLQAKYDITGREYSCAQLQKGIISSDYSVVKDEISRLISDLKPKPSENDRLGHGENFDTLLMRINKCGNIHAEMLCYGCIKTYPAQSEIIVKTDSSGIIIKRTLDILTSEDSSLRFVAIHN
jgi:hypothetical protein